jgi:predicted NBD/HSP70 family sugar kinase
MAIGGKPNSIGVVMAERMVAGVVSAEGKLVGPLHEWPADAEDSDRLLGMPTDEIVKQLCEEILAVAGQAGEDVSAIGCIGLGLPGIVRLGVVEDSPNLVQLKGARIAEMLAAALRSAGITAPITVNNDADVIAAGVAATKGQLDKIVRVWTLGNGVGYGHYPCTNGAWEGGHMVVSLDSKETYCGCGGRGHLEGFCGYRAMRLRFMDMEPEEIFAEAKPRGMKQGDARCVEFVKLYHRALAAATANCIHQEGPGKFYFSGYAVKFVDLNTLEDYLHQMVKLSPLQTYALEIIAGDQELGVVGAAVAAMRAASPAN